MELCANLPIGGTTPSIQLYKELRNYTDVAVRVLIRPRFGDFCYTEYEKNQIQEEIAAWSELDIEGVVIGALNPDGTLDVETMKNWISSAGEKKITLHRAFDMCREPFETMEQAILLGVDTILTSGQQQNCLLGASLLQQLQKEAGGRIQIMAGGGVGANLIECLVPQTGIYTFHMSGKETLDSAMIYRKSTVSMGLPSLSEYEIWRTSESKVRAAREVLDKFKLYG